jgi:transcriptional regulator with XRE-family HTH domain
MTTTAIPGSAVGVRTARTRAARYRLRRPGPSFGISPSDRRTPVTTLLAQPGWIEDEAGEIAFPVSAPGVIGGAIIKAARRSAGLSRQDLAPMLAVSSTTVRTWENGARPLFSVRYDQLCQTADALRKAGAHVGQEVGELVLASQCDLLIAGILHGFEDYAEVPPVDEEGTEGEAARGLLAWALTGVVPDRYRAHSTAGTLLAKPDMLLFAAVVRDLQVGSSGCDLASYGAALFALTKR